MNLNSRKLKLLEIATCGGSIFCRCWKVLLIFSLIIGFILKGLDYAAFRLIPQVEGVALVPLGNLFSLSFGFLFSILSVSVTERSLAGHPVLWSYIFERVRIFFLPAFLLNLVAQLLGIITWLPDLLIQRYSLEGVGFMMLKYILMLTAIVLTFYFSFVHQALILRDKRGGAAFAYSFRAVKSGGWAFVATLLLVVLMTIGLVAMVSLVLKGLFSMTLSGAMSWGYPLYTFLGTYLTICFTVLFLNMDRANRYGPKSAIV
jgi:hypothetical protein